MAEKEVIVRDSKIKFTGTFDLDRAYMKLMQWMEIEGYAFKEDSYLQRVSPDGKIIEVVFSAKKEEAGYFLAELTVKIFAKRIQDAEGVVNGEKMKLDKGELELIFGSTLVWNSSGDKDVYPEGLKKKIYERFILQDKIEDMKIALYKDTVKFVEEMKAFLNLYAL